ncbi:MAG: hypothetical protein J6I98_04280, partial [Clostridia bacterium]|nr:hypothetical protein [Clostridia bacterium]
RARQAKFFSLHRELPHALECIDRFSMYCGLQIETPFADRTLIEYIFNLPQGVFGDHDILSVLTGHFQKPEAMLVSPILAEPLKEKLSAILRDDDQPINRLIDPARVLALQFDDPQNTELLLWLLQSDLWMNHYKIRIML